MKQTYGQLFVSEMKKNGRVVLGLYRTVGQSMPYVITNPRHDVVIMAGDKMYVLEPSRSRKNHENRSSSLHADGHQDDEEMDGTLLTIMSKADDEEARVALSTKRRNSTPGFDGIESGDLTGEDRETV